MPHEKVRANLREFEQLADLHKAQVLVKLHCGEADIAPDAAIPGLLQACTYKFASRPIASSVFVDRQPAYAKFAFMGRFLQQAYATERDFGIKCGEVYGFLSLVRFP